MSTSRRKGFSPLKNGDGQTSKALYDFEAAVPSFSAFKPIRKTESILQLTGDGIQLEEQIAAHYVPLSISPDIVASMLVGQIPRSTRESRLWALALITLHGAEDSRITFDITDRYRVVGQWVWISGYPTAARQIVSSNLQCRRLHPHQRCGHLWKIFSKDCHFVLYG